MAAFNKTTVHEYIRGDFSGNNGSSVGSINVGSTTIDGYRDPSWKLKVDKHINASLPYFVRRLDLGSVLPGDPVSFYLKENGHFIGEWSRHQLSSSYFRNSPIVRDDLDALALTRLKRKISNVNDQFKALVPLAEIKETRGLIKQVAKASTGLLHGLIDLKHGRVKDAAKRASDAWLTFSFGVSPTVSDINSLASSIDTYLTQQSFMTVLRGKAVGTSLSSSRISGTFLNPVGANWNDTLQWTDEYSVVYTAGIMPLVKSSNDYGLSSHFGLTFGEIIPTAWELLPFSWIVDYFTTTGEFMSDAFSAPGSNTIYCTKSVKVESRARINRLFDAGSSAAFSRPVGPLNQQCGETRTFIFKRTVESSIPSLPWRIKTIDEVGANSIRRLLNLASLLLK